MNFQKDNQKPTAFRRLLWNSTKIISIINIMTLSYSLSDFDEYNLSTAEIQTAAVIFSSILAVICVTGLVAFGKDVKRLSWTISLVNSFAMTVIGIIYLIVKVPQYQDLFFYGSYGRAPFHSVSNVAFLVSLWFGLANIVDLAFGIIFYPKYLGLLTAYVHHSVFIWIMLIATTGNGIFMTATPFASSFMIMLIEELPTFLLALGSVFPAFRTDLGFGLTFFLLRIAYHGYFLSYSAISGSDTVCIVLYSLTMLLHLNWFYNWVTKYAFSSPKAKKSVAKAQDKSI